MKICWDKYLRFTECPQAYQWDYVNIKKSTRPGTEDTQYLVKGNTVQDLVGSWLIDPTCPWLGDPTRHIADFLDKNVRPCLLRHWQDDKLKGTPQPSMLDLVIEIQVRLTKCLPNLRNHIVDQCGGVPPIQVKKETAIDWSYPLLNGVTTTDVLLEAVTDVQILTPTDQLIIYEGKNTKYPQKVEPHQVWWQSVILGPSCVASGREMVDTHFMVFYYVNEIRPIPVYHKGVLTDQVRMWVYGERDRNLQGIVNGYAKATPDRNTCRLCSHRYRCPDKWVKLSVMDIAPAPGGIRTEIL